MKTLVIMVCRIVPEKETRERTKQDFVFINGPKVRPTNTTKGYEECIVWRLIKENLIWGVMI